LISITYAVSFAVYPGILLSYDLFDLSIGFKINTLLAIHNICDTIGRYIPNYFPMNKFQITILVFFRCIFLITYPLLILIQRSYDTVNNFFILNYLIFDFYIIINK
jgi:hypothetical protein